MTAFNPGFKEYVIAVVITNFTNTVSITNIYYLKASLYQLHVRELIQNYAKYKYSKYVHTVTQGAQNNLQNIKFIICSISSF